MGGASVVRLIRSEEMWDVSSLPFWQIPGKGLRYSLTDHLRCEVTASTEGVEGVIEIVAITRQDWV